MKNIPNAVQNEITFAITKHIRLEITNIGYK